MSTAAASLPRLTAAQGVAGKKTSIGERAGEGADRAHEGGESPDASGLLMRQRTASQSKFFQTIRLRLFTFEEVVYAQCDTRDSRGSSYATGSLTRIALLQLVEELLLVNPETGMTGERAQRGAKFDADRNLISWDLSCCPIYAVPESEPP